MRDRVEMNEKEQHRAEGHRSPTSKSMMIGAAQHANGNSNFLDAGVLLFLCLATLQRVQLQQQLRRCNDDSNLIFSPSQPHPQTSRTVSALFSKPQGQSKQEMTQRQGTTHTASLLGLLLATNSLVNAFLPITPVQMRSSIRIQTLSSNIAMNYISFRPASPAFNHAPVALAAAAMDDDKGKTDKIKEELEHELPVGEHEEEGAEAAGKPAAGAAPTTVVDDVFNSLPFLQKRKEAMEKEMASIDENLQTLSEQFGELAGEWDGKVAVMKRDYDNLKAKYYNDTLEVATTGRSNVFVEIMGVVDDFERARMAYKPGGEEEAAILESYEGVKDAIVKGMMNEGLVEVKTVGEPFDFKLHDCMFTEASDEWPEDIITREFSKGFMIGEKVVRPAKVACSLGPGP